MASTYCLCSSFFVNSNPLPTTINRYLCVSSAPISWDVRLCICLGYFPSLCFDPNIILGIMDPLDPDNTKNQVILILKYYLYKCRCLGDKPSINGGLKYLKYCIKIEKTTINFLSSIPKEYICKKWLPFKIVLGV